MNFDRLWAHQASYPMGMGVLSWVVKRLDREADRSLACSAKVKNAVLGNPYVFTGTT